MFEYTLIKTEGRARAGILRTPHGDLPTPVFAPVGTQATVKTMTPRDLTDLGSTLILANTYHLYLRPGSEIVAGLGGLHRFMAWPGPILTDSGGYQVFSLSDLREVDDEGVTFRSHLDGSTHRFTPEKVVAVQQQLGSDIAMCLDVCAPPLDRAYNEQALARTHAWAERSRAAHTRPDQALFGIVQGGVFPDLREASARYIASLDLPGNAIGGLSVGESKEQMHATLDLMDAILPAGKPRYLMGVGTAQDFFEGVARGVDIFDCVLPTRLARHGAALIKNGRLNLRNAQYTQDETPIEQGCGCYTCRTFTRAYVRHLLVAGEILGLHLISIHNLHSLLDLMRGIRAAILDGTFETRLWEFRAANAAPVAAAGSAPAVGAGPAPAHPSAAQDMHFTHGGDR